MSEKYHLPENPILFFLSKILILGGMILVFTFVGMGIGLWLSKLFFGVDVMSNPNILNQYKENSQVLKALKLTQVCYAIFGFLIPALLFPKSFEQRSWAFARAHRFSNASFWIYAFIIFIISTPFINQLVRWNESIRLPGSFAALESKFKAAEVAAKELTTAFVATSGSGALFLNLIIMAVLPAICEEFLFRGALLRFLQIPIKNIHISIFVSAAVFSAFHGQFYGFIPRMVLGMILGYVVIFSGSIWPSVILHFLNNTIATCSMYYGWENSDITFLRSDYHFPLYTVFVSLLATVYLLYKMYWMHLKSVYYNGE